MLPLQQSNTQCQVSGIHPRSAGLQWAWAFVLLWLCHPRHRQIVSWAQTSSGISRLLRPSVYLGCTFRNSLPWALISSSDLSHGAQHLSMAPLIFAFPVQQKLNCLQRPLSWCGAKPRGLSMTLSNSVALRLPKPPPTKWEARTHSQVGLTSLRCRLYQSHTLSGQQLCVNSGRNLPRFHLNNIGLFLITAAGLSVTGKELNCPSKGFTLVVLVSCYSQSTLQPQMARNHLYVTQNTIHLVLIKSCRDCQTSLKNFTSQASTICTVFNVPIFQIPTSLSPSISKHWRAYSSPKF